MRKRDSLWRDEALTDWHVERGFYVPAAGLPMPFIEYDQGEPVGLVSYLPVHEALPTGWVAANAYRALGQLFVDGDHLPLFTVRYDLHPGDTPMYSVLAHNEPASDINKRLFGESRPWMRLDEADFARVLYAMRGRPLADLARYGVVWGDLCGPSREDHFPGASMSVRRRNFEPDMQVSPTRRIPCTDIDLMIPTPDGRVGLVVDYKTHLYGVRTDLKSSSLTAMASLMNGDGRIAPAMVVHYDRHVWTFMVQCLNSAASQLLSFALGSAGSAENLASAVVGDRVVLNEDTWHVVLDQAAF